MIVNELRMIRMIISYKKDPMTLRGFIHILDLFTSVTKLREGNL